MNWMTGYLDRLGLSAESPSYAYLSRICRAHLSRHAFENISKLYYLKRFAETGWLIPPIEEHVANMQARDFGGTCFTANSSLQQLLTTLGFDAYLVGFASEHMGMVVRLPEGRFYVDVGSAQPFFDPVPFADEPVIDYCGVGAHVYRKAGEPGTYHFDQYLHGTCNTRWEFYPDVPLQFADFAPQIATMNTPGSVFLTILRCQLWQPEQGRGLSLVNNSLAYRFSDGSQKKVHLADIGEIEAVIAEEFRLPKLPLREAVGVLASLGVDIFDRE